MPTQAPPRGMRAFECIVTETHRKTVVVIAPSSRDAREMAERGPGAWQDAGAPSECVEWQVEAVERQDDGETDEMTAWKERCE